MVTDHDFPELVSFRQESDMDLPTAASQLPATPQIAPASAPRATDVRAAVLWEGSWEQPYDGTSIITRRYAKALDSAGLPVFLSSHGRMRGELHDDVLRAIEPMLDRTPRSLPVAIHHLVPSEPGLRHALYPSASFEHDQAGAESRHGRLILLSVWEQLPSASFAKTSLGVYLRKFAAHIVPCDMNAEVLLLAGVPREKIHVIPHPFDEAEADALQAKRPPINPAEPVAFYTMGKWEPRKDPMAVLRTFLRAARRADRPEFPPEPPHFLEEHGPPLGTLTIVTSDWWQQSGYPRVSEALETACRETGVSLAWAKELVRFVVEPQPSLVPWHRTHEVFVTASHGEAWGMPAFDAVVAGNLVLAPQWGGFAAYLPLDGALDVTLEPVHPGYAHRFGNEPPMWAKVDLAELEDRMVALMTGAEPRRRVPYSEANFRRQNPLAVGRALRAVVESLLGPGYAWR
jgi:glycosyltransferase involved in cell wall biosynthesis